MKIDITLAAFFRFAGRMAAACVLGWAAHAAAQPAANAAGKQTSTADHAKFAQLHKPFRNGHEVTEACLSCHTEAARQVMATKHWTWDFKQAHTGQQLGKKNVLNPFCIGTRPTKPSAPPATSATAGRTTNSTSRPSATSIASSATTPRGNTGKSRGLPAIPLISGWSFRRSPASSSKPRT